MTFRSETTSAGRAIRAGIAVLFFAVVLAMFPFTVNGTGPIKTVLLSLGAALLSVLLFVEGWLGRQSFRISGAFSWIILVFLLINLLAALKSIYFLHSLVELVRLGVLVLLYLVSRQVYHHPRQVRVFLIVVCSATFLSTLYGFGQGLGIDPFPWAYSRDEFYAKLPGTFGNPNYAAHAVILCIIFAVYLAAHQRLRWCALFAPVFLLHLYLTEQRGGWVALAASVVLVLAARAARRLSKSPQVAVAAALLITAGVAGCAVAAAMVGTYLRNGSFFPMEESLYVRYNAYASSSRMIQERPLLGYGPGNYVIENTRFWTPVEQERFAALNKMNDHVHNDLLEVAIEAGLAAVALYVLFLVVGVCNGLYTAFNEDDPERRKFGWMVAAFFCAFAADGLFGFNSRVPVSGALLFLLAGMADGLWSSREFSPGKHGTAAIGRGAVVVAALLFLMFGVRHFLAQVLHWDGMSALRVGRYAEAERALANAERYAPWDWVYPTEQGVASLNRGDLSRAELHFRRALTLNPQYLMAWINLASVQLRLAFAPPAQDSGSDPRDSQARALREGVFCTQRALELCPALPEGRELQGRIGFTIASRLSAEAQQQPVDLAKLRELWKETEGHLRAAVDRGAPNPASLYVLIARIRLVLDDADGAQAALIEAIELAPELLSAWSLYAQLAEEGGSLVGLQEALYFKRDSESIRRWAKELPPDAVAVQQALAAVLSAKGDSAGARDLYRNLLESPKLTDEERTRVQQELTEVSEGKE